MPFIRVLFRRCFIRIFTTALSLTAYQQSTSRDSDVPPSCVVGISQTRLSGTGQCHFSGTSSSVGYQVECNTHTWQHGNEIGVIIKQCSDQPIYSCDQWENTCNKTDILSSDDYFIAFFDFHDTKLTIRYGISLRLCDRVFSPCRSRGSCYCLINNDFQLACQWGTCGAGDILMPFDWKISRPPVGRLVFFRQRRTSPQFTTRLVGVKQAKTDGDIQIKKVATMKTNSHIKGQSEAQSLRFNQIKRVAKVVAIIIGAIIGTLVWAIVRPVIRGAGWVTSLITAILIIYWLFTL